MCVSLFGCNSSLELKSIESLDLKNLYIYTNTAAPTIVRGHKCGIVEIVFNIGRLSVQNSNCGNSSIVGVDLQPVGRVKQFRVPLKHKYTKHKWLTT